MAIWAILRPPAWASRAIQRPAKTRSTANFWSNAQGEDVVAGIRTPEPITDLEKIMPAAYAQLREITSSLEKHYRDMQDFEFTIEDNKLYMLQTRNGKRTGSGGGSRGGRNGGRRADR